MLNKLSTICWIMSLFYLHFLTRCKQEKPIVSSIKNNEPIPDKIDKLGQKSCPSQAIRLHRKNPPIHPQLGTSRLNGRTEKQEGFPVQVLNLEERTLHRDTKTVRLAPHGSPPLIQELYNSTELSRTSIEKIYEAEKFYRRFKRDPDIHFRIHSEKYTNKTTESKRKWFANHTKYWNEESKILKRMKSSIRDRYLKNKINKIDTKSIKLDFPPCKMTNPYFKFRVFVKTIIGTEQGEMRRNFIEKTWGENHNIIYVAVRNATSKAPKNSVVISGIAETEDNLAVKYYAVLHYLNRCRSEKYYAYFTDDDVYNFLDRVDSELIEPYQELELEKNRAGVHACKIFGNLVWPALPRRDPSHKYYMSEEEYPFSIFPQYCSGMSFLVSPCAQNGLFGQTKRVPILRHNDDAMLGIFRFYNNINHKNRYIDIHHDVRFGSTLKHEDNGQFRCDTFSIHQRNIDDEFLEQMEKMSNQKPDIYFEYVQKSVE